MASVDHTWNLRQAVPKDGPGISEFEEDFKVCNQSAVEMVKCVKKCFFIEQ